MLGESQRYELREKLGAGGCGEVWLATDRQLQRDVAIKIARAELVETEAQVERFLTEARVVAGLRHSSIVPVHDAGRTSDGRVYVVSDYIPGGDLEQRRGIEAPTLLDSLRWTAQVAEALHYIHNRDRVIVHRDVKPANILVDEESRAYLADFGLALVDEDAVRRGVVEGTPLFMSPEQASFEGHKIDHRSDIYSLGAVLYWLLLGRTPFQGETPNEVIARIRAAAVPRPRDLDDGIDPEVERICLRALERRLPDRYACASEMAEDLRRAFASAEAAASSSVGVGAKPAGSETSRAVRVAPNGLRAFDEKDREYFLQLVPGPRNRDGVPLSVRFWIEKIDETDPDETFGVGLIYGPSGCGKSSFVRAGILPRLDTHVLAVAVDASDEDTQRVLEGRIRELCPELPRELGLAEMLERVRRGRAGLGGRKLVLVLDQFEQYLHGRERGRDDELVRALRQCDGEMAQAILLVRDDFWMATSRFFRELEVEVRDGVNCAPVDLFDRAHARRVLFSFGHAFHCLPENRSELTRDQNAFLDKATAGLAESDRIVPVRLVLFAELFRRREWGTTSLKEVGGMDGVGETFLEESFDSETAPKRLRHHGAACRAVLAALLPELGTEIKGHARTRTELLAASGYAERPADFDELLVVLDREMRLLTPVDPVASAPDAGGNGAADGEPRWQLAHDYLVPSVRGWLRRRQQESPAGRAELLLEERARLWSVKRERKQLPGVLEWAGILALTRNPRRRPVEREMLGVANRLHGLRLVAAVVIVALVVSGVGELQQRARAGRLVESLRVAPASEVLGIAQQLREISARSAPLVLELLGAPDLPLDDVWRLLVALPRDHEAIVEHLGRALGSEEAEAFDAISRNWMSSVPEGAEAPGAFERALRVVETSADVSHDVRMRARVLAVGMGGHDLTALEADELVAWLFGPDLRVREVEEVSRRLQRAREGLLPLVMGVLKETSIESVRERALTVLANLLDGAPGATIDLLGEFPPTRLRRFLEPLEDATAADIARLEELARGPRSGEDEVRVAARAAAALARLGRRDEILPRLRGDFGLDERAVAIEAMRFAGTPVIDLLDMLVESRDDPTSRSAALQVLGDSGWASIPPGRRAEVLGEVRASFFGDPDAEVHGSAEWLLRRWERWDETLADPRAAAGSPPPGAEWRRNSLGNSFVRVETPGQVMITQPERLRRNNQLMLNAPLPPYPGLLPPVYWVATTEVSNGDYRRYVRDTGRQENAQTLREPDDLPYSLTSHFDAMRYCNWLSKLEGLAPAYPPAAELDALEARFANNGRDFRDVVIPVDRASDGYRLPTEAEAFWLRWRGRCRPRSIGRFESTLRWYASYMPWSAGNKIPVATVLPTPDGIFDEYGNQVEMLDPGPGSPYVVKRKALVLDAGGWAKVSDPALLLPGIQRVDTPISFTVLNYGFRLVRTARD